MSRPELQYIRGVFFTKLDDKNRIKIPKDMVDIIRFQDRTCVLMIMPDPCLAIYAEHEWYNTWVKTFQESQSSNPVNKGRRELDRIFGSKTKTFQLENQGRVTLPDLFRDYAGLEKEDEIAIIGAGNKVEIWNREKWEGHSVEITKKFDEIVEKL